MAETHGLYAAALPVIGVGDERLQLELVHAGPGRPAKLDLLPRLGLVQSARAHRCGGARGKNYL